MKRKIVSNRILQDYLKQLADEEKCSNTREKYKRDIEKFIEFTEGRPVTKAIVVEFKKKLKDNYKPLSVNSMLAAVNGILSYMGLHDCKVKTLRIQKKMFCSESRELHEADCEKLIRVAKRKGQERIQLIITTISGTGIRVSELKYITVESLADGKAVIDNKGKIRVIFINNELCKMLALYARKHDINEGAIFITKTGKAVDRSNVWREMKSLCKEAGVDPEKVFPHNLRGLFAKLYYELHKDISKLADLLGHANIETTRGYIMHSGNEHCLQINQMRIVK